jgi:hypothetical protein
VLRCANEAKKYLKITRNISLAKTGALEEIIVMVKGGVGEDIVLKLVDVLKCVWVADVKSCGSVPPGLYVVIRRRRQRGV